MASVTKRGKTYCLRYWYEDEFGVSRQKRVSGFKTKEDAWSAARDLEAKSSAGIDVHGDTMTCEELLERWFAAHCLDLAATTRAKYSNGIDQLTETFVKDLPVKKLSTQRFGLLLEEFRKRVSIRTAVDYTEPLRQALSWAIEEKLIPIKGTPPDMLMPPPGCPFSPRCRYCMPVCRKYMPPETALSDTHRVACHLLHPKAPKIAREV